MRRKMERTMAGSRMPPSLCLFGSSEATHFRSGSDHRKKANEELLTRGLEPPRVAPYGPEPYASANSATRAYRRAVAKMRAEPLIASAKHHRGLETKSSVALLSRTRFDRCRLAGFAERTQQIGVIGGDDRVVFGPHLRRFFPSLKRCAIEIASLHVVAARMIDDRKIALRL